MNHTQNPVLLDRQGAIAIVTLNRPDQRNAMDAATTAALRTVFDQIEGDDSLRVTILAATGPVFCAGMDLKAFLTGEAEEILFGPGRFGGFVSRKRKKPVIACVQGAALAGGFELVLACDLVVATENAVFGLPESRLGLVAGAGGAFRVGQRLPPVIANEIVLLGGRFDAAQAQVWGLVNRVTKGDPMPQALELAARIAANAPLSVAASLGLAGASADAGLDLLWSENDRQLRHLIATEDAREGARAFAEKRDPDWRGR